MAVYKVIQNIEAEDKLVGPLGLRQFVYATIAGACVFINFRLLLATDLGIIRWIFIAGFSLPMILFGVLAAPLGGDQPTELWLLSHLKFFLSSRQRVWDQEGQSTSVTITAPKVEQRTLTKNLTQGEVKSRLEALTSMLDSRGWAIQQTPLMPSPSQVFEEGDRLVGADVLPQQLQPVDERAGDDVLDEKSNATAQRYGALVKEVEEQKRQQLAQKLSEAKKNPGNQDGPPAKWDIEAITPITAAGEGRVFEPDEEAARSSINEIAGNNEPSLEDRLKQAAEGLRSEHPQFTPASPLAAERQQRAQKRVNKQVAMLSNNGNFTVSTLASLANRDSGVPI